MSLLYNIKYNLDEALLKQEAYSSEYEPFVDPLTETVMPLWLMCKKVSGYGAVVAKDFRNIRKVLYLTSIKTEVLSVLLTLYYLQAKTQ
jgi:hypothetical protein